MKNRIVFLNKKQIEHINCPEDMSFLLSLSHNPNNPLPGEDFWIDQAYVDKMDDGERVEVVVVISYDEEAFNEIINDPKYLGEGFEEFREERNRRIVAFYDSYRTPIEEDYGIYHEDNIGTTITLSKSRGFSADRTMLSKMLADSRIEGVLLTSILDDITYGGLLGDLGN